MTAYRQYMFWMLPFLGLTLLPNALTAQYLPAKRIALHTMGSGDAKPEVTAPVPISKSVVTIPRAPVVHLPLEEYRITSPFGWRRHPVTGKPDFHNGIDLAMRAGIVRCIMYGTVVETGYHRNLGKYIRIDHAGVYSIYGHLSHITVDAGQVVTAGYPIGITGNTGRTTGEHLHFSIRRNGSYINPWKFLHGLIQKIDNEH